MASRGNILLVSVNTEEQPYPVYPLALDYLRGPLQQVGYKTRTWDARTDEDLVTLMQAFRPDVALVSIRNADNNDSANTKNYLPAALAVVNTIKQHSVAKVVLGGSGYSLFPEEILAASHADCGITGAGEHVVVPLVDHLLAGTDPRALPGLVRRDVFNPPSPPPATAVLAREPELVRFYWEKGGIPGVQLKRGCPYECVYCTYPLLEGRKFLQKDAVAAVDEIQQFYEMAGVDQFFIVDSVFNAVPTLARAFGEELCRRKLPIRWGAYFMPKGVTRDDLLLWKESGLDGVEFGMDTLCPSLLTDWGKGFTLADARQATQACVAAGIPCSMYLIFGGPGETHETMEQTIAEAQSVPKAVMVAFLGMRIYPHTRLHAIAHREGVIRDGHNLLEPKFYISPALNRDRLVARCNELGRQFNWLVVGPSFEKKTRFAAQLRRRGRKGALWQELIPS